MTSSFSPLQWSPRPPPSALDRAVAAYLTRFTVSSRELARSDLHCFLAWCAARNSGLHLSENAEPINTAATLAHWCTILVLAVLDGSLMHPRCCQVTAQLA
jgi:hypothetical protein